MTPIQIYNCHTHIFNRQVVPLNFLPFYLRPMEKLLASTTITNGLKSTLEKLGKHELALLIQKFHLFVKIGDLKTQLAIFKHLQGFYPEGTKFCVLTMDMEFMKAGKVPIPFEKQLEELKEIKENPAYTDLILPFIFVHPERKNIFELVQRYIEQHHFAGIKIYPPLGYYPFDKRLDKIYSYAEKNQIPITTHCSRGGIYYQGKITDEMLIHPENGQRLKMAKNKFFTDVFTDPNNYKYVLEKFPNLKINLAHFGGQDEWEKYLTVSFKEDNQLTWYEVIKDLIRKYPNVYTDISYTLHKTDLFNLLKITLQDHDIKNRILYGSDYYMVEQELSERQFSINLRAFLGEEDYRLIAERNPRRFFRQ